MKHDPLWTGIRPHGAGWRATVSQGRDRPKIQQHFPKDTDPRAMQEWRKDTAAELRVSRKQRPISGSFAWDVKRYLAIVAGLTTFTERDRHMRLWLAIFDGWQTNAITKGDIRMQRDRWLTEPRSAADARPLGPNTVNKRLRALSNFFTELGLPNPVRDVEEAKEPAGRPKSIPYPVIAAILAVLRPFRHGKHAAPTSVSKAAIRLRVLAYCPITPEQLRLLTPADLNLPRQLLRLPERDKGQGADGIWVPLLPEAAQALTDFHDHNCYGTFAEWPLARALQRARRRAGVTSHVTPYMLRHSFATLAYRATGSLEAVSTLLQHAHKSTTRRYAMGAESDVVAATMQRVADHLAAGGPTDWRNGLGQNAELGGKIVKPVEPVTTNDEANQKRKQRNL